MDGKDGPANRVDLTLGVFLRAHAPMIRQVVEAGWTLVNADCVLIGEQPRIAAHREEMRSRLSEALGGGEVNVRATTTDHLGFTGRGEGLAAQAVALLESA